MKMTKTNTISTAIRDFVEAHQIIRGDLLAKLNPTLLKVAWDIAKESQDGTVSGYELIMDWNAVTEGAGITKESVDRYIAHYTGEKAGTQRQHFIAEAVRRVLQGMKPSFNKNGGKKNSQLINLGWKLLKQNPNDNIDEFTQKLEQAALLAMKDESIVKYRTPSKHKIKNQDIISTVTRGVVEELKTLNVLPFSGKITTQLAGTLNAVAWKFLKLDKCTHDDIMNFITGKNIVEIKAALKAL